MDRIKILSSLIKKYTIKRNWSNIKKLADFLERHNRTILFESFVFNVKLFDQINTFSFNFVLYLCAFKFFFYIILFLSRNNWLKDQINCPSFTFLYIKTLYLYLYNFYEQQYYIIFNIWLTCIFMFKLNTNLFFMF